METISSYGTKSKYSREKNIEELDALKNQHICWATVTC